MCSAFDLAIEAGLLLRNNRAFSFPFTAFAHCHRRLTSTSSHKWETYRRRRFGRFSRRRATSILRSVRKERATQKIGQSAIGPQGWLEKGPSASLLARYGSQRIRSSLAPSIQTLLKPTVCLPLMRRCTSVLPFYLAGLLPLATMKTFHVDQKRTGYSFLKFVGASCKTSCSSI